MVRPRLCHEIKSLCRFSRAARRNPKHATTTLAAKQIIAAVAIGIVDGRGSLCMLRNTKICETPNRTPAAMLMVLDVMARTNWPNNDEWRGAGPLALALSRHPNPAFSRTIC